MKKALIILVAVLALVFSFAIAEEACAHNWVTEKVNDATCTSGALYKEECSNCGASNGTFTQGSAKGHSYETVTTAPTCTAAGSVVTTCKDCGDSKTETVAATGHSFGAATLKTAGTCTVKAIYEKTCTVCKATEEVVGDYAAHNWKVTSTAATCTVKKTFTESCTVCGTVNQTWTEGDTLPHNWHITEEAATCTTEKMRVESCTVCDTVNQKWPIGDKLPHTYAWVVVTAPTCTEAGANKQVCSVCNAEGETAVVAALGHTAKVVPGYAPTCTEAGLTDGSVCEVCGTVLVEQVAIPALGHSYVKVRVVQPTETTRGFTEYACEVCGDWYRARYTAALGEDNDFGAIVSDLDDNEKPYTAIVDTEAGRVTIEATANEDGTIELRELHISLALVEEWKAEGIVEVAFVVGDAEIIVPFAVLEAEMMEEVKAAFPATLTGYIVTLDPNAVNDEGTAGCLVKVDLTADVASAEKVVAEDGIEMEVTDVITGMNLTYADKAFSVVGGGVYTL